MPSAKYTRAQFEAEYPNDDACLEALFKLRYGKLTCCPSCGVVAAQFYRVPDRRCYACVHCRYQIFPTASTIMHRSPTSLKTWFTVMYAFALSKNGVSAKEIQREHGLTYKYALRIARQVRKAMAQNDVLLCDIVECDEAYIGGRRRSSNRFRNKTPVIGAVQRGGEIRAKVTDWVSMARAKAFLEQSVAPGSTLYTDESRIYVHTRERYKHDTVVHGKWEFVREEVHSNTIEGFWGHLKPCLTATHRAVSRRYLQFYVDEFVWRYNYRQEPNLFPILLAQAAQPL